MALRRVFTFDSNHGRADFRLAYEAFRGINPEKIQKDERRLLAEIQRELESISEPIGREIEDSEFDIRSRKLTKTGQIELSQRAFEKLVDAIETALFHSGLSMQQQDLLERLSAAEKVDTSSNDKLKLVEG